MHRRRCVTLLYAEACAALFLTSGSNLPAAARPNAHGNVMAVALANGRARCRHRQAGRRRAVARWSALCPASAILKPLRRPAAVTFEGGEGIVISDGAEASITAR